eukprot:maker-scaffold845_size89356-snap-gene-0.21 protein:Tk02769 transcript:maker-scaffold845_size89356-snap-gene-0.21-mRNA-1 annotation:"GH13265"
MGESPKVALGRYARPAQESDEPLHFQPSLAEPELSWCEGDLFGPTSQFDRAQKASVSVRLRKPSAKQHNIAQADKPAQLNQRHSGDFGRYFPSGGGISNSARIMDVSTEEETEDWSFVTFPNGQPNVQEIQASAVEDTHSTPTPVKVVTKRVPGLALSGNAKLERLFATNKIPSDLGAKATRSAAAALGAMKRQSCDFSALAVHSDSISASNRLFSPNPRRISVDPSPAASGSPFTRGHTERDSKRRFLRRKNDPNASASSKRCSGEFHFVAQPPSQTPFVERQISLDVPTPTPRLGLGRRAATQLSMSTKRNSFKAAMYKSQETLVQDLKNEPAPLSLAPTSCSNGKTDDANQVEKRGYLWQQRDKIFSRWKERWFTLTRKTLSCYKRDQHIKTTANHDLLYQVQLLEVCDVELLDKRGYLTICITLEREGKVFLRRTDGIREWYKLLVEYSQSQAHQKNSTSNSFWSRRQLTDSSGMEHWLQKKKGLLSALSGSTPDVSKVPSTNGKHEITLNQLSDLYDQEESNQGPDPATQRHSTNSPLKRRTINRLSLMTDFDLPDLTGQLTKGCLNRHKYALEFRSNDSGNHSISTNVSVGSTTSSVSKSSSSPEDKEDWSPAMDPHLTHLSPKDLSGSTAVSPLIKGLQVTHV